MKEQNNISLKEYFDTVINSVKESIKTAYDGMEKRLEGMNEFRDSLKDQAARFITRDELDTKLAAIDKGKKENITLIVATLGLLVAIVGILMQAFK